MNAFRSVICLFATFGFSIATYAYDLKDLAILGEYTLVKPDSKADIQRAELIYNSDNELVLRTERGPDDYRLSNPDRDGVVFKGEDEANCDGGEYTCSYDSSTVIKLLSTKDAYGNTIPQISIKIITSYAWRTDCGGLDDNGNDQPACEDDEQTYVLNWNKRLEYSIPFYTNFDNPPLQKMNKSCMERLKDVSFYDISPRYLNAYDICGYLNSFKYRDNFDAAFPYVLKDWVGGNQDQPSEKSAQEILAIFDQAKSLAKTYKANGKVTSQDLLEEIEKLKSYVLKANRFFVIPLDKYQDKIEFFAVNTNTKIIVKVEMRVR